MTDRAFLDTNILVYLFDGESPGKQRAAAELIARLEAERVVRVISTQVLQETCSAVTRKLGVEPATAVHALQLMEKAGFQVEVLHPTLIWRAASRSSADRISFWDGLIVEAALSAQCTRVYSEDLQAGRKFDGLEVINPFQ